MNISFWNISAIYRDWLHSLGRYISKGCQHYWTCIQKASFSGSMKPLIILSFPPKLGREFENYQVCVQTLLTFLIHLLFTHGPYLTTILSQIWHVVENKGKRLLEDFLHISRIFGSCRSQYGQISPWCPGLRWKQMSLRTVVPLERKFLCRNEQKRARCAIIMGFCSARILKAPVPRSHPWT